MKLKNIKHITGNYLKFYKNKFRNSLLRMENIKRNNLIICNLCSQVFKKNGPDHSEFLKCLNCGSIARDRVIYYCLLEEMNKRHGIRQNFVWQNKYFSDKSLIEFSPRYFPKTKDLFFETFGQYLSSDFDMSMHAGSIKMDLTNDADIKKYENRFDIVIFCHILEHIPDYRLALRNLHKIIKETGFVLMQLPLLESKYTKVTWDEFHGDNTRVYHRFAFDIVDELEKIFSRVKVVVGQLNFKITSPEIHPEKYLYLRNHKVDCEEIGPDTMQLLGLGSPDLCEALVLYK